MKNQNEKYLQILLSEHFAEDNLYFLNFLHFFILQSFFISIPLIGLVFFIDKITITELSVVYIGVFSIISFIISAFLLSFTYYKKQKKIIKLSEFILKNIFINKQFTLKTITYSFLIDYFFCNIKTRNIINIIDDLLSKGYPFSIKIKDIKYLINKIIKKNNNTYEDLNHFLLVLRKHEKISSFEIEFDISELIDITESLILNKFKNKINDF
jgi:hypothetical protein